MKTIYSMGKGKYIHLDTYGETHESSLVQKAALASVVLAVIISAISAVASKYVPLDPQIMKASKSYVMGY